MKKLMRYPLVVLFALFIVILSGVDMIVNRREFSEMENRYLEQKPRFTWKTLMNKKFAEKYETYINDQFVFRDQWIGVKSRAEIMIGKQENNGVVYGKDNYMFSKYDTINEKQFAANIKHIKAYFETYQQIPAVFSIIPNSYMVLPEKVPFGLGQLDQTAYTNHIYEQMPDSVQTLSLQEPLSEQKDDYLYYRTDHHWTTTGAYQAYAAFVRAQGMEPVPLEELKGNEVPGFYGTYYSKSLRFNAVADTITWYDIPVTDVIIDGKRTVLDAEKKEIPVEGLYNQAQFEKRDKYGAFLYGNNGVTVIKSDNNQNPVEGKTSRILVIKDSYGNSLVPFLTYHYDEVVVVDLRSVPEISKVMQTYEPNTIWLLYNFDNFTYDVNLVRLKY